MSEEPQSNAQTDGLAEKNRMGRGCLEWLAKNGVAIVVVLIAAGVLFSIARSSIYKIRPYERGLHLRGGGFRRHR